MFNTVPGRFWFIFHYHSSVESFFARFLRNSELALQPRDCDALNCIPNLFEDEQFLGCRKNKNYDTILNKHIM